MKDDGALTPGFQSLIGTIQTDAEEIPVLGTVVMFQSLIGTIQTHASAEVHDLVFTKFQSLIGTIQTLLYFPPLWYFGRVSIPHRYDTNVGASFFFCARSQFQSLIGTIQT